MRHLRPASHSYRISGRTIEVTRKDSPRRTEHEKRDDSVLAAAGSFTGLWALTWLGSSVMGAGAAVQGAFATGGVMAGSGLTVLWWRYQAMTAIEDADERAATEST